MVEWGGQDGWKKLRWNDVSDIDVVTAPLACYCSLLQLTLFNDLFGQQVFGGQEAEKQDDEHRDLLRPAESDLPTFHEAANTPA